MPTRIEEYAAKVAEANRDAPAEKGSTVNFWRWGAAFSVKSLARGRARNGPKW
jgi:hypothetical protein